MGTQDEQKELAEIFNSEKHKLEMVGKHLRIYFEAKEYTEEIQKLLESTKGVSTTDKYTWKLNDTYNWRMDEEE